ncbi:hypothetical protein PIB30_057961 [Stylosanthes scabra]|uniref:Uncharacterized protein n=1 Tax=Stylosanthes scabra TaxID=79078 RepID=A0ABU6ZIJ4_9FABA|nr:hypothetical protein [Stylosanthes scabra]
MSTTNSGNTKPANSTDTNNVTNQQQIFSLPPILVLSTQLELSLERDNHTTWQQQATVAIRGQILDNQLHSNRIPQQFPSTLDEELGIESPQYQRWVISLIVEDDEGQWTARSSW